MYYRRHIYIFSPKSKSGEELKVFRPLWTNIFQLRKLFFNPNQKQPYDQILSVSKQVYDGSTHYDHFYYSVVTK